VEIHDNVTEIGCSAFSQCSDLTTIKIPDGVKVLRAHSFSGCTSLESVVIGNGVEEISSHVFSNCSSLDNISFGAGLKRLGTVAFSDCTGITHIELPYGLEEIGTYAFQNCTNLVSITIPVTVTSISSRAFSYSGLTFIFYQGTKEQFDAIGCGTAGIKVHYETDYHIFEDNSCKICDLPEFKYSWTSNTAKITKYNGRSKVVSLPSKLDGFNIVSIGSGAFTSVEEIYISEKITNIATDAINIDAIIYCYENSYAHRFAEENGYSYEIVVVSPVNADVYVDSCNNTIVASTELCNDVNSFIATSESYDLFVNGQPATTSTAYIGTGSIISIYDGDFLVDDFTMVVEGDTNGDSVCDALDTAQVILASNDVGGLSGAYKMAADSDSDGDIDVYDYQTVVNKSLL
jgi:hypothetical protein